MYGCVVLDALSRKVVGWSIDASPTVALVTNALGMTIDTWLGKTASTGTIIHAEPRRAVPVLGVHRQRQGVWTGAVDGQRLMLRQLDGRVFLVPDAGSAAGSEEMEASVELANVIFDYLEIWHNRQRRHSKLGMLTPIEFERNNIITVA